MSTSAIAKEARALLHAQRWAALATLDSGAPLASMVAYAIDEEHRGLLLFLSQLAQHTKNLLADPRASLVVSEPDAGDGDPQRLQRLTLQTSVAIVRRDDADYVSAAERYVDRFPDALPRFELGDFVLFRLTPVDARYVGGFARAARFTWSDLAGGS